MSFGRALPVFKQPDVGKPEVETFDLSVSFDNDDDRVLLDMSVLEEADDFSLADDRSLASNWLSVLLSISLNFGLPNVPAFGDLIYESFKSKNIIEINILQYTYLYIP